LLCCCFYVLELRTKARATLGPCTSLHSAQCEMEEKESVSQREVREIQDHQDRVDQIVRVDANGLLKTIRELEYKLSEHTRPDKPPAWAVALELRLAKLEHNAFDMTSAKHAGLSERVVHVDEDVAATEGGQPHSEGHPHGSHRPEGGLPGWGDMPSEKPLQPRNLTDMAHEMRLMQKVRSSLLPLSICLSVYLSICLSVSPIPPPLSSSLLLSSPLLLPFPSSLSPPPHPLLLSQVRKEVENKFSTAEITLESKIVGFNLQLDRLHKLLQIRPTTSELQVLILICIKPTLSI
jgi:hypothetical protein